jgi:uncharacterized protein GlcG (DUF336 family)
VRSETVGKRSACANEVSVLRCLVIELTPETAFILISLLISPLLAMTSSSFSAKQLIHRPSLSLFLAQTGLDAAISHAQNALSIPVNISIFSPSLHLLAFASMDNAKLTSIDIAHNKAFTAAGHRAPTSAYDAKRVGPGGSLFGVQHSNGGRFTTIMGGVPVIVDGRCVGAIGVSGGTPSQDEVGLTVAEIVPATADQEGDRQ